MKTAVITVETKDPDGWGAVIHALGLTDEKIQQFFLWGEYATIELTVSEDMTVTGQIVPVRR